MDTDDIVFLSVMKEHLRISPTETGFDGDILTKMEEARRHIEHWVGPLNDFGETADLVPDDIKGALKLFTAHLYAHREATATEVPTDIALGFHDLIGPYRKWEF